MWGWLSRKCNKKYITSTHTYDSILHEKIVIVILFPEKERD